MKLKALVASILLSHSFNVIACPDSMSDMKRKQEKGGWTVIWSESYGTADAAILTGCVLLGCAGKYLGHKLERLTTKVGASAIRNAIRDQGVITRSGDYEFEYGTAYWSKSHKIWNPIKNRHECVTTERYARLYLKYKKDAELKGKPGRYGFDEGIFYVNGENAYCRYYNMEEFGWSAHTQFGGNTDWKKLHGSVHKYTNGFEDHGVCDIGTEFRAKAGRYGFDSGIFYSNGSGAYCQYRNMRDFTKSADTQFGGDRTWKTLRGPVESYNRGMRNDGYCHIP